MSNILNANVDLTRLAIADAPVGQDAAFSFLVIGDTDAGTALRKGALSKGSKENTREKDLFAGYFSEQVLSRLEENRFLLHTGDIAYPTGSYENYFEYFLKPYRQLLTRLPGSAFYRREAITFNRPLLVVPGNHDYAQEAAGRFGMTALWRRVLRVVCDRLRLSLGIDWGHYGGFKGEAFAQTFLDDLDSLSPEQLKQHLMAHYGATLKGLDLKNLDLKDLEKDAKTCLDYRPGMFTRLPNRYYSFRYGGIDFFALDSNTWNKDASAADFDQDQLDWLEKSLICSLRDPEVGGRIAYLHHSPYTTESFHWQQPETLWVRRHLRAVLDKVSIATDRIPGREPLLDLVLSGHAHCLEHLKTMQTSHADAQIDWVVCGGSGASVRRQRRGEDDLLENVACQGRSRTAVVARSQVYAGRYLCRRNGKRTERKVHSFVQVDVRPRHAQKITVRPFLVICEAGQWQTKAMTPFAVGSVKETLPTKIRA